MDYVKLTQTNFKGRVRKCIELLFEAEEISNKENNLPIEISTRMTRTNGYFQYRRKIEKKEIIYSPMKLKFTHRLLNGTFTKEYMDEIILHECIHYLLFQLGYHEETHGMIFKRYCRKYGCKLENGTNRNEYSSIKREEIKKVANTNKDKYTITCENGDLSQGRTRASNVTKNPENYRCPNCRGKIIVTQNY